MLLSTMADWLVWVLVLPFQLTILYVFGRLFFIGGGFELPNPFQPGWSSLYAAFGTTADLPRLRTTSARVGLVSYGDFIEIGFGDDAWFLRKTFFSNQAVRIPYAAVTVLQAPARHTVLRIPVHTDGLFAVRGVRILLKRPDAEALLARLAPPAPLG